MGNLQSQYSAEEMSSNCLVLLRETCKKCPDAHNLRSVAAPHCTRPSKSAFYLVHIGMVIEKFDNSPKDTTKGLPSLIRGGTGATRRRVVVLLAAVGQGASSPREWTYFGVALLALEAAPARLRMSLALHNPFLTHRSDRVSSQCVMVMAMTKMGIG